LDWQKSVYVNTTFPHYQGSFSPPITALLRRDELLIKGGQALTLQRWETVGNRLTDTRSCWDMAVRRSGKVQEESNANQDPLNTRISVQPAAEPDPPEPVTTELASESEPDSPTDGEVDTEPRISRSQERRQQECRSLPWRLGLANLLSAGLHLIAMSWVGWQPGIPAEAEIITFQWVEVAAEPPLEPEFIAPISARESGGSERWDPYVSVRQSRQRDGVLSPVASPRDGFDFAEVTSPAAGSFHNRPQPLLPPPVERPEERPEVPQPAQNFAPPQQQPEAKLEAKLKDLEQAVADQNWAEALQLTEEWLDRLPLAAQQRGQLQDYGQHLQSLLSTSTEEVETEPTRPPHSQTLFPQPEEATSSPEVLPQPHLLAQADARPILPPPEQSAALPQEPLPTLTQTFPAGSHSQGSINPNSGRVSGIESSQEGSPSLNAIADLDWGDYLAQLQEKVRQHWVVQRAPGSYVTVVQIRLDREGSLRELRLQTPSEDPLLDAAVLSAIQRSAPFAPLPEIYAGEELMLEIDVLSGSLEASPIGDPKN
jgi:TonB family protein